ncbi:MAG: electron transport complex subunit RsxG [Sulfuritalea sp.]|jgi:electron transport complex protein RnfG|nr:electron transport complex subunit RsxG [Sulfuritalea sp.]
MSEPIEVTQRDAGALRISVRTAAIMLAFTVVFTALMAGVYVVTAPLVAASAQKEKLALIGEVLPSALFDNVLLDDWIEVLPTRELGSSGAVRLYRARKNGEPAALVVEAAAPDGYSGRIGLLLAVKATGELLAVRVTEHRETPGLGDYIDPKKDKNKTQPWITQFSNLGFDTVPQEGWRVKKDGGRFDQRAGATISARAVTNASGRALAWTLKNRDKLFTLPANSRFEDQGSKP